MLGGLGLLLAALVVYFVIALARYRSAVRRARKASAAVPAPEGEARYLGPSAETAEDPFALATSEGVPGTVDVVSAAAPSQTQVWDFSIPQVHQDRAPDVAPAPVPPPASPPAPVPRPAPVVEPVVVPQPEPELPPAPAPAPEPEPEPKPAATSLPGYSLADELDRLMMAAEQPAPLLTPAEHEAVVAPASPAATEEPMPMAAPEPLYPQPSVGRVLSAPAVSVPTRAPVAAESAATAPPSVLEPIATPERVIADVPPYALVAPVELHFTGGSGRIGVKPGTRSFVEFQRLAGILLQDLKSARGW